jgi:hypothetical protein
MVTPLEVFFMKVLVYGLSFLMLCFVLDMSSRPVMSADISPREAGRVVQALEAPVSTEPVELTDEQLAALLTKVDRFFVDQGMAGLTVDVDLYRDPSNRLNSQNIRESNPSSLAGLTTIVSHYAYKFPTYYQLTIMGEVLAGSEVPPDRTFYSQLIPMPGAPIFTDDIRSRFTIRFEGEDTVENVPAYRIRYSAKDPANEFFDYIVYYIDPVKTDILRVEGSFDNLYYRGVAEGNFYYDDWLGKYLPIYAHGNVLMYPDRRYNLWAKWHGWKWQTEEDLKSQAGEGGSESQP